MTLQSKSPYVDIFNKQKVVSTTSEALPSRSRNTGETSNNFFENTAKGGYSRDVFSSPSIKSDLSKLQRQKMASILSTRRSDGLEMPNDSLIQSRNTSVILTDQYVDSTGSIVNGIASPPRRTTRKPSNTTNPTFQQSKFLPRVSQYSVESKTSRRSSLENLEIDEISVTTTIPLNDEPQHVRRVSDGWLPNQRENTSALHTPLIHNSKKKIRTTPYSKKLPDGDVTDDTFDKHIENNGHEKSKRDQSFDIGTKKNHSRASIRKLNSGNSFEQVPRFGNGNSNSPFDRSLLNQNERSLKPQRKKSKVEYPIELNRKRKAAESDDNETEEEVQEQQKEQEDDGDDEEEEEEEEEEDNEEEDKEEDKAFDNDTSDSDHYYQDQKESKLQEKQISNEDDDELAINGISNNWDPARWENFCNMIKLVKKSQKEKTYSLEEKDDIRSKIMEYFNIESVQELYLRIGVATKSFTSRNKRNRKKYENQMAPTRQKKRRFR